MKAVRKRSPNGGLRAAYDFAGGQRGKYANRFAEGTKLVLLERDVAAMFPDAGSVNRALRKLADIIRDRTGSPRRAR